MPSRMAVSESMPMLGTRPLIVTSRCGIIRRTCGPIDEVRPGDVVWFSAGEKH